MEPNVFKELLRYIYIGQVALQRMDKLIIGLFAAADKYLLKKLKKACRDHLVQNICKNCYNENVVYLNLLLCPEIHNTLVN